MQDHLIKTYDIIYATDLVYKPSCWKLCGDGHCCHLTRYKAGHSKGTHEIMLLPEEWEYMQLRGYEKQFSNPSHIEFKLDLNVGPICYRSVKVNKDSCPCQHDIRPTTCRLYPLLPKFNFDGLIGVDPDFTLFEVIESAMGFPRACKINEVPFKEMDKFFSIVNALRTEPILLFHIMAYEVVKDVFKESLRVGDQTSAKPNQSVAEKIQELQTNLIFGDYINWKALKESLEDLGSKFSTRFGANFLVS